MVKKNIAFLTYGFSGGGTEKVISILLKELSGIYNIHLVLTSDLIGYPIPENVKVSIINKSAELDSSISRVLKLPLLAWKYYQICKQNNIEISFSFLNRPNFIACMLRFLNWNGIIYISERTSTLLQYQNKNIKSTIGKFLVRRLYPKADLILPNSFANAEDLKCKYKIKATFQVIYNPINVKDILIQKEIQVEGFDDTSFTYVMLGRFVKEKDHTSLLIAFSMLPHKNQCKLVLIGVGYLENDIRCKIAELDLSALVVIIPFVLNPYKYLSKAQCFVFSSLQEGFPNVLLEALACSLPIISTDCKTGPRELLAPGTDFNKQLSDSIEYAEFGILVPVKKPIILAKAMQQVFDDKEIREKYKRTALSRANNFDIPVIMKEYRSLLG